MVRLLPKRKKVSKAAIAAPVHYMVEIEQMHRLHSFICMRFIDSQKLIKWVLSYIVYTLNHFCLALIVRRISVRGLNALQKKLIFSLSHPHCYF